MSLHSVQQQQQQQQLPLVCAPSTRDAKGRVLTPLEPRVPNASNGALVNIFGESPDPITIWETFVPGGCSIAASLALNPREVPIPIVLSFAFAAHGNQPAQVVHRTLSGGNLPTLFEFDHVTRIVAYALDITRRLTGTIHSFVCTDCSAKAKAKAKATHQLCHYDCRRHDDGGGGGEVVSVENNPSRDNIFEFLTPNQTITLFDATDNVPTLLSIQVTTTTATTSGVEQPILTAFQADGTIIQRPLHVNSQQVFVFPNVIRLQIVGPVTPGPTTVRYRTHTNQCLTCATGKCDATAAAAGCGGGGHPALSGPLNCSFVGLGSQVPTTLTGSIFSTPFEQTIFESFPGPTRQVTLSIVLDNLSDAIFSFVTRDEHGKENLTLRTFSAPHFTQTLTVPNAVRIAVRFTGENTSTFTIRTYKCLSC